MIDFIYVIFLTSTSKLRKRKSKLTPMNSKKSNNQNPAESLQETKIVEYHDYFFTSKNKKVTVKHFGEKTALLNSFFFEYLKKEIKNFQSKLIIFYFFSAMRDAVNI